MPPAHPPEFRRRAIELARERSKPIRDVARDLGISRYRVVSPDDAGIWCTPQRCATVRSLGKRSMFSPALARNCDA